MKIVLLSCCVYSLCADDIFYRYRHFNVNGKHWYDVSLSEYRPFSALLLLRVHIAPTAARLDPGYLFYLCPHVVAQRHDFMTFLGGLFSCWSWTKHLQ